jgi:hypothetical protein
MIVGTSSISAVWPHTTETKYTSTFQIRANPILKAHQ